MSAHVMAGLCPDAGAVEPPPAAPCNDALEDLVRYGIIADRVRTSVAEYAANELAHANQVTPLVGSPTDKRLRVGNFRVIFREGADTITVAKIGPRGNVYD